MSQRSTYPLPPRSHTQEGAIRRMGAELEFSGVELSEAAAIVARIFEGDVESLSAYELVVDTNDLGRFNVELDFEYLKARGREERPVPDGIVADMDRLSEEAIAGVARQIVPIEVVTPPIPMDRLAEIDKLVDALRAAGARGTRHSPIYAFGLHLNPEMPALDSRTMLAYTQSFLCLHDWLIERERVDLSRRVTPYINAFPREYLLRALAHDYAPNADEFADDYLTFNADRNRALDLLPLLAHLDRDRVRSAIDDPRIKSRPALHYRLPNCEVDVRCWGIHSAWGHWLAVERLAAATEARTELCQRYLEHLGRGLASILESWPRECDALMAKIEC